MKFISWNVNGLRAVMDKGFTESMEALDADFVCLQETKLQEANLKEICCRNRGRDTSRPYEGVQEKNVSSSHFSLFTSHLETPLIPNLNYSYWSYADKKGYSGTAIFTKHEPLSVSYGMSLDVHDHEGRLITLEYPQFYLVCCYTPNSQDGLKRLDYRMQWEDDFRAYLLRLDAVKPTIVCGDLNVAHEEIDLKNPKTNRQNAGFTDQEREKMTTLLAAGFTDTFRHFHPTLAGAYSWWSYRFRAREKNAGWRIDYFLVSNRLVPQLQSASIHNEIFGSDHCPVELVLS